MKYILAGLLITSFTAQAAITFNSSVTGYVATGTDGAVGLNGFVWNYGTLSNTTGSAATSIGPRITVSGTTLANGGFAFTDPNGYSSAPDATFNATTLVYSGGPSNTQTVASFLGSDGASLTGVDDGHYGDSLFRFQGYLKIASPNTTIIGLGLRSDDGSRFYIGDTIDILATANGATGPAGSTATSNDGGHGATTFVNDVTFADAGYYPVDIRYFEGAWQNSNFESFGAGQLAVRVNGGDYNAGSPQVSFVRTVNPIPEPATAVLAGLALLGLGRRRRRA